AGQAAYQRARLLVTSSGDEARAQLKQVIADYAADTLAASSALYLLADLATDDGDDARAAALFKDLYTRYPRSARAPEARFRAAVIDLVAGNATRAASALDSLVARYPRAED